MKHILFADGEELLAAGGLPLSKRAKVPCCLGIGQLGLLISRTFSRTNVLPSICSCMICLYRPSSLSVRVATRTMGRRLPPTTIRPRPRRYTWGSCDSMFRARHWSETSKWRRGRSCMLKFEINGRSKPREGRGPPETASLRDWSLVDDDSRCQARSIAGVDV